MSLQSYASPLCSVQPGGNGGGAGGPPPAILNPAGKPAGVGEPLVVPFAAGGKLISAVLMRSKSLIRSEVETDVLVSGSIAREHMAMIDDPARRGS